MRIHTVFSISLSMIVVGCAIRPLPKNVTRDTTLSIVEKIRCEARDAVIERILRVLREPLKRTKKQSDKNMKLLRKLENLGTNETVMKEIGWDEVDIETRDRLLRFAASSIAYTFMFTVSEQKIKKGNATFNMPFTNGMLSLGLGAGSDKTRTNIRMVELADNFHDLVRGNITAGRTSEFSCDFIYNPRKHWVYPITGEIGMAEVINTFISLHKTGGVTSFSDKLTFKTNFDVSANPIITLDAPIPKKFKLTKADLTYEANRKDEHEVKLVLKPAALDLNPVEKFVEFLGYTPLVKLPKTTGFPEGAEVGLTFKRINKEGGKPSKPGEIPRVYLDGSAKKKILGAVPVPPAPQPSGQKLFSIRSDVLQESMRGVIAESRRLDSLDTSRSLRDLIGK